MNDPIAAIEFIEADFALCGTYLTKHDPSSLKDKQYNLESILLFKLSLSLSLSLSLCEREIYRKKGVWAHGVNSVIIFADGCTESGDCERRIRHQEPAAGQQSAAAGAVHAGTWYVSHSSSSLLLT